MYYIYLVKQMIYVFRQYTILSREYYMRMRTVDDMDLEIERKFRLQLL